MADRVIFAEKLIFKADLKLLFIIKPVSLFFPKVEQRVCNKCGLHSDLNVSSCHLEAVERMDSEHTLKTKRKIRRG